MRRSTTLSALVAAILVIGVGSRAWGSDPIGVYALIDKVVIEPSEAKPERIQIWGAFVLAEREFGNRYAAPVRGFLYYKLPGEKAEVAKAEWADLAKLAGTGQVVSFASRYAPKGRIRTGPAPEGAAAIDAKRVAALVAQLDDPKQGARDAAGEELARAGAAAQPALRESLAKASSAEAKVRLERIVSALEPDAYPLGFGLTKVKKDTDYPPVRALLRMPAAVSPADGAQVAAGKVKLVAGNVADGGAKVTYRFEIESEQGEKEASEAIAAGAEKRTEWSPKMAVEAGKRYTWRVWVEGDAKNGGAKDDFGPVAGTPMASATFRAK